MTTQEQQTGIIAEMFPVPAEAKRLERFLGDWSVEGSVTMEGNPARMTGSWRFTPAAAGWGVRAKLEAQVEGLGAMDEDDLAGFDAETGSFHVYSLTNTGNVHDHAGGWPDDNTFQMAYDGLQEGKAYREEVTISFLRADELEIHGKEYVGGQLISSTDVTLRKR